MASGPTSYGPFGAGPAPQGEGFGESEQGLQPEVITPETENESEYWRRYRAWRRLRRYGRGSRRRRFLRWRRRFGSGSSGASSSGGYGGASSGGYSSTSSDDEPDSGGDSSGDDSDSGSEMIARGYGELPGESESSESESEVRRYGYRGGYRSPAYRYRAAVRPYRFYSRGYVGRRAPYYGRTWYRGRYPYAARTYTGYAGRRYWPWRRSDGGRFYSPYAYRRWPWLYRRYYGYGAPAYAPSGPLALPPPVAEPAPAAAPAAPMAAPGAPMAAPSAPTAGPSAPMAGPEPSGSPWILLVQSCLRKVLGPDAAPMNGRLGGGTRRALRAFQQQNGLPPSGDLDAATVQALQAQCVGGQAAAPAAAGAPPPDAGAPPAEPAGGAAPGGDAPPADAGSAAPDAGAAPPDGGAPGGDAPPPESEIALTLGRPQGETEQEFLVDAPAQIDLMPHLPVPIDRDPEFNWAPNEPGLYVIYVNNRPWYVGIAETTIRHRFLQRRKVLNDFQIPMSALAGRLVEWYTLNPKASSMPAGALLRRPQRDPNAPFRPHRGTYALLRVLEQVFIRLLNPPGNQVTEPVQISPRGSFAVTQNNKTRTLASYGAKARF